MTRPGKKEKEKKTKREEIGKGNPMTALRFQTGEWHQTSPASLRGSEREREGGGRERERAPRERERRARARERESREKESTERERERERACRGEMGDPCVDWRRWEVLGGERGSFNGILLAKPSIQALGVVLTETAHSRQRSPSCKGHNPCTEFAVCGDRDEVIRPVHVSPTASARPAFAPCVC